MRFSSHSDAWFKPKLQVPALVAIVLSTLIFFCALPGTVLAQRAFEPAHIERSGSVEFGASPAEVFAALEPRGKKLRSPSWNVELLHPASGEARPGAVLRQTHKGAGIQQIWTVVASAPPARIKYVVFVPNMETWMFDMHLSAKGDGGTVVRVDHQITSLSEQANRDVLQFAEDFDAYLERWKRAVAQVARLSR